MGTPPGTVLATDRRVKRLRRSVVGDVTYSPVEPHRRFTLAVGRGPKASRIAAGRTPADPDGPNISANDRSFR